MLGHGASNRGRTFDYVEPVHLPLSAARSSTIGEFSRVTKPLRMCVEKIRFQRENHFRFVETIMRLDNFAESDSRALTDVVACDWFILMPLCFRESVQ